MQGRPGCLLQSAGGETNRILLASALSSMHAMCPNRVRKRHYWIIAVSLGCFVSLRTSSFWTNWYHLMPSSIHRHLWSSTSILRASIIISKFYIIHLLQTTEWVYIDADMSMRTHVTAVVRACFAALRQCRVLSLSDCRYSLNPLSQTRID